MKKIAKIIVIALLVTFVAGLISSCRSSGTCPAYGETSKYQIETRY
ncbi:MAG: hypothetical protein IKT08_05855 [Bacteroidales bacterium]|nr:hypothetical protein [Bacteroidales bacterium]